MAAAIHAAVVASVLLLLPSLLAPVAAQAKAKAFCISQFAIASQACSILPPSPPEEDHHHHDGGDDDDHGDDDDDDHNGGGDRHRRSGRAAISISDLMATANENHGVGVGAGNVTGHHHGNRTRGGGRGHGRRGRLRDDHRNDDDDDKDKDKDDDDDDEDDDDDGDDNHEHHDEELRAYRDCCRWLKEVQKECVCEALQRLPPFLVKPQHTYAVRVGRTCRITYRCGGA